MTDDELIALAIAHKLGRAMKPLGMQTGDVFVTDQSYRTGELLAFAAAVEDAARMEWMSRCQGGQAGYVCPGCIDKLVSVPACWACGGTQTVTTSSNGSGLIEAECLACAEDDGRCPTCGKAGGTSCGAPNCGLLT